MYAYILFIYFIEMVVFIQQEDHHTIISSSSFSIPNYQLQLMIIFIKKNNRASYALKTLLALRALQWE